MDSMTLFIASLAVSCIGALASVLLIKADNDAKTAGCLIGAVAGIASLFGVLAAHHVYHESGNAGSNVVTAHQVIYVVHLSADEGVRSVVLGELSQRVSIEEVVAGCQGKGGERACYQS